METWRVYGPVVADFHHFDEEQDLDPDPHLSEKLDPDPHLSEKLNPDPHLSEKLYPNPQFSEKLDPNPLKVHKIENFFGSEFEFYTISLLVMLKY